MKHFPSSRYPTQIAGLEHTRSLSLPGRSRVFWFLLGFFAALNVAGWVAGLFHWPN